MVMAVIVAVFINHERTQELTRINADALLLTGKPIAAALAEGLREREREAMLLSHHPLLTQGTLDSVIVHAHFDEIKQSFPFYSWIGVADTDGVVQVSTGGLLKHQHVTQRPWFVEGLKGPYTGDAHEALLLDKYLRTDPNDEPLRFLDFASPVRWGNGEVRGVLAIHLNWAWTTKVITDALAGLPHSQNVEVLILNRNGEFLHPRSLPLEERPASGLPSNGQFSEVMWGKGGAYLTTTLDLPETTIQRLGWTVVVRQPMSVALAPIQKLHETLAWWSIGLISLLMWMTYWIASRFSLPIERLERAARQVDASGQGADFTISAGTAEVTGLYEALQQMTQHLLQSKRALMDANAVLEQKVLDRTAELEMRKLQYQGILEDQTEIICRFSANYTLTYVNEAYCRMFRLRSEDVLGTVWAPVVYPDDLKMVEAELAQITAEHPVIQIENRVIAGDGQVRWCQFVNRAYFDDQGQIREWQTVGRDITKSKSLESQVHRVSEEFQDLYNHAPCGYYSVDVNGVIIRINDLALSWMGVQRAEVLHQVRMVDFLDQDGQSEYWANFLAFREQGHMRPIEFNLQGRDGITRRIRLSATAVNDANGTFLRSRSIMFDMTELHLMRHRLGQLNAEQEAMLDNDLLGIAKLRDRNIVWRNKALERIFGYDSGELLGVNTACMYASHQAYQAFGDAAYPALDAGQHFRQQMLMRKKDGSAIWLDISGVRLSQASGESLWLLQDISEMKQFQAQVEHLAFHDSLTNLPNRLLLSDHLRVSMALNDRTGTLTAMCYLDLNGFKPINDRYGHEAGDEVLVEVAQRLQATLRANDTAARLGGDEFAMLLTNLGHPDEVEPVIRRIHEAIERPISLKSNQVVSVSTSIGVAFYPLDAQTSSALYAKADEVMYRNKKSKALSQ